MTRAEVEAEAVLAAFRAKAWRIATAESCTGGLIAAALTAVPGSSDVFDRGFVTYSNDAKSDLLGVPAAMIGQYGAVSRVVAEAMAAGALARSLADAAVAVTGIAGPGGATPGKPVGLVHVALASRVRPVVHTEHRFGAVGRDKVRRLTMLAALAMLAEAAR